ncbi:putative transferase [Septoria linicola]|nr:putative transferase [Septoria linicola]
MSDPAAYRLSSLDQAEVRSYIRCCYCFSHNAADVKHDKVILALESSVSRVVEQFPILAGSVVAESEDLPTEPPNARQRDHRHDTVGARQQHPLSLPARRESTGSNTFALLRLQDEGNDDNTKTEQHGRLKVVVLPNSQSVKPKITIFASAEFSGTYGDLAARRMPPSILAGHFSTPLSDIPDPALGSNPVFAVQADFINGGVVVAIFLHHAVADVHGLAQVVHCMSNGIPVSKPSLQSDSIEQSRSRDRLSGSRGIKATMLNQISHGRGFSGETASVPDVDQRDGGSVHVLAFDLDKIEATAEMMNERVALSLEERFAKTTPLECLISILWKSFARARRQCLKMEKEQMSILKHSVNMRMRLDPPLGAGYFGNACISAKATADLVRLSLPFDVGTLGSIAGTVHNSRAAASETQLRATIAAINDSSDVRSAFDVQVNSNTDVLITDWVELPMADKATLDLGLGPADFVREVSRESPTHGFLILPKKQKEGQWEVVVRFDKGTISYLLGDVGLMPFLLHVA